MRFGGGEFSTGTMRNFQPELTPAPLVQAAAQRNIPTAKLLPDC
jgi:hypothetical protein